METGFSFSWSADVALALLALPLMVIALPVSLYQAWRDA